MNQYANHKDNGKAGKNFEVAVRMFITPKTTVTTCKSLGKVDHFIKLAGKRVNIEVKSGAGTLDYADHSDAKNAGIPASDFIASLMPKTDFIIYTPEYDGDAENVGENAWVFTRQDFINFLQGYAGMVRYTNKQGAEVINIQSFKNSKVKNDYVWNGVLDQPSLADWLTEVRG